MVEYRAISKVVRDEIGKKILAAQWESIPGERYAYSNAGYTQAPPADPRRRSVWNFARA